MGSPSLLAATAGWSRAFSAEKTPAVARWRYRIEIRTIHRDSWESYYAKSFAAAMEFAETHVRESRSPEAEAAVYDAKKEAANGRTTLAVCRKDGTMRARKDRRASEEE